MSAPALRKCLFLDRDGVVNESVVRSGKPYPPADWTEVKYVPGIHDLCKRARDAGWLVIIATNQPDVGRGTMSQKTVEDIHEKMMEELALDDIIVCYDPGQGVPSDFRKPAPGMLLRAAARHGIDLVNSFMVGDRWRDVSCGHAAGCRTIFIDYAYDEALRHPPDYTVKNLLQATAILRPFFSLTTKPSTT